MLAPPTHTQRRSLPLKLMALATIIAALLSMAYLRISQINGRLAGDLQTDDVVYANDAAHRLTVLAEQGFYPFFRSFYDSPPHSPFSTLLALFGFSIGGFNDFPFYASNSLILILSAVFIAYELKSARTGGLVLGIAMALSSPLAFRTIHDFRPDIALGLATAVMTWWFFTAESEKNLKLLKVCGYLFAACLLIKPSFFAHSIAIALFIFCVSEIIKLFTRSGLSAQQKAIYFLLSGAIISSPYFILNGAYIFQYFWQNTQGAESAIWSYTATTPLKDLIKAYLLEKNFTFQLLGYHLFLSAFALTISLPLLVFYREKASIFKISGTCAAAIASFLIIVI